MTHWRDPKALRDEVERMAKAIDPDCFDRTVAQLGFDDGQLDEMTDRREAARDLARRSLKA